MYVECPGTYLGRLHSSKWTGVTEKKQKRSNLTGRWATVMQGVSNSSCHDSAVTLVHVNVGHMASCATVSIAGTHGFV